MRKSGLAYLSILVIYFVVDVLYQVVFGLNQMSSQFETAGIDGVMTDEPQYIWTVPIFFLIIAFVLLRLVVLPAIDKASVSSAFLNGALVGVAAYGTLAVVLLWSVRDYPPTAGGLVLLEGLLFPTISSGFTAWWFLRNRVPSNPTANAVVTG